MFSGILQPSALRRLATALQDHPKIALRTCHPFRFGVHPQALPTKSGVGRHRAGAMTGNRRAEIPYRPLQVCYCHACERVMTLVRSIARLGKLPQLDTWRCVDCGKIETIECRPS
jgi:hypothetical protein